MSHLPFVEVCGRRIPFDPMGQSDAGSVLYRLGSAHDQLRISATYWPFHLAPRWYVVARYTSSTGNVVEASATGHGSTLAEAERSVLEAASAELPTLFRLLTRTDATTSESSCASSAA